MKKTVPAHTRSLASRFFVLSLMLGLTAVLTLTAQTRVPNNVSLENFGRVNENYFRGSQPKADDMHQLKRYGVKTVIDLRNDRLDKSEGWAGDAGLQYFHIALSTKKPATDEQVAYFLKLVNDPANWPVYVHCKGGRHRTGEMTAIYRMTNQGWTADQSYKEMQSYDFEDSWWYPRVLKKFVYKYYDDNKQAISAAAAKATAASAAAGGSTSIQ